MNKLTSYTGASSDPDLAGEIYNIEKLVKSHFANDIEQFGKKIQNEPGVKNFKLFEGVSPSF